MHGLLSWRMRLPVWLACALAMLACQKSPEPVTPPPGRCEVDLAASGLFSHAGVGASARVIDNPTMLIGGEGAKGRDGDVLLQNEKIRVIIEQPGRTIGPVLSGGHLIDADIVRPASEPGHDGFGRVNIIYALGRLSSVETVEVLNDGSSGGPAVVASTGHDAQHDLISVRTIIANQAGLDVQFVIDPTQPLPLRTTTYYVLSPGESRVRALTAVCNSGRSAVQLPLVELLDIGASESFFPGGCANGLGSRFELTGCAVESARWFAAQGRGVAYGFRPASLGDLHQPSSVSAAMISYAGMVGSFYEGESLSGVLAWTDRNARSLPGAFVVRAGEQRSFLRDFVVGRDLAAVTSVFARSDGPTGRVNVAVGQPEARVSVVDASGVMQSVLVTDASGRGTIDLAAGDYRLSAATPGRLPGPVVPVSVVAGGSAEVTLELAAARTLTVSVTEVSGAPSPAKVTVYCHPGRCPFNKDTWLQHQLLDYPANGAAAIGYVPVSGSLELQLPPGQYEMVVTRGPEFSTWPDTWPRAGALVDLTAGDQAVSAVIGRIIDSTGWMSADLHVHALSSVDSSVPDELRAADFLAEGVDILVSTDHDVITDYAPAIASIGASGLMTSMIGEEVTTFTHGHFNCFPLVRRAVPNGGAFDHAGGEAGPTPRLAELFSGLKAAQPGALVQLNHPRESSGVLTLLKVDSDTLHSHGAPADFNMEPSPEATADDTGLFGAGFDVIETSNGPSAHLGVLNDWMTLLSRGTVRAATGVSDTHTAQSGTGGYARTFVKLGYDAPSDFQPADLVQALRARQAFVSNGPYLRFSAVHLDAAGQPTAAPAGIGQTLSVAANEAVELTVDVTGPDWMALDRIEIYSHASGREAFNGVTNDSWPDARVLQMRSLTSLTVEPVPGPAALRRVHQVERFVVHPTADTWYVAMARGLTGRTMRPLHGERAMAYSNAILIDADGSGAYDQYPLVPGQGLKAPAAAPDRTPRVPSVEQLERAIRAILDHGHHGG